MPKSFTKILEYRKLDEDEKELTIREVYCFPNDRTVKRKNLEDYLIKELSY